MNENDTPNVDFDEAYRDQPPWEIGLPQPAIVALIAGRPPTGPILDVGCGTGENALAFAAAGLEVVGVDSTVAAIRLARAKAADRGLDATFVVGDAYDLGSLRRRFPTIVDSALLHVIGDRPRYAESLASAIEPGGRIVLLEISDRADIPYPKISEAEIRSTFAGPAWMVESLEASRFDTHLGSFPAWLGTVARTN